MCTFSNTSSSVPLIPNIIALLASSVVVEGIQVVVILGVILSVSILSVVVGVWCVGIGYVVFMLPGVRLNVLLSLLLRIIAVV